MTLTTLPTNETPPKKIRSDNDNSIVFPVFDIFTIRIGFGNEFPRVITIAYEIRYHPHHMTLLKSILINASVLNPNPHLIFVFILFPTASSKPPIRQQ